MFGSLDGKCLYLHRQNSSAAEDGRRKRPIFMPAINKQEIQTAPGVVADNAHKGIALETLTARSAVFQFYVKISSVMNYKKMKERIERKEEAVKNLIEFLANENDYSSMMTELAIAQTSVMKLAETARIHGDRGYMEEIYTFFITITDLLIWIEPLSDFAKLEKEDE